MFPWQKREKAFTKLNSITFDNFVKLIKGKYIFACVVDGEKNAFFYFDNGQSVKLVPENVRLFLGLLPSIVESVPELKDYTV